MNTFLNVLEQKLFFANLYGLTEPLIRNRFQINLRLSQPELDNENNPELPGAVKSLPIAPTRLD